MAIFLKFAIQTKSNCSMLNSVNRCIFHETSVASSMIADLFVV